MTTFDLVGRAVGIVALALVAGLGPTGELRAQTGSTKSAVATQPDPSATVPLGRFVAKENLLIYIEFAGLDAHNSAWRNTAACKMLNDTPLGGMLEMVSGQLIDRALTFFPSHRLSGPELVTLVKGVARSGWVFALHVAPKAGDTGATFVLRGAASKELKLLSSRLVGWMMGAEKPKIERKDGGRSLVVVPRPAAPGGAVAPSGNWVWWPEKNDLVLSVPYGGEADRIIAALDGKIPTAVDHTLVQELKKPEGSFEPVCVAFVDVEHTPKVAAPLTDFLHQLHEGQGVERIDLRWGFDGDALVTVTRLTAPKPWKSFLAVLDEPTFGKTTLMAMPDSVESFVELSISPSKLLDALEQLPGPAGAEFKAQLDQLNESIKTAGSIDLKKDILSHLGPKMVAYLAPGRTATTNDDSLEALLKNGLSTTGAVTAIQTYFPKLTLVAEVQHPEAFGKGLDTAMIAINNELKAQAIEKEAEDKAAAEKSAPGGAGRPGLARGEPGVDRTKRRRPKEPSYPHFQATIGQAKTQSAGVAKSFVLMTPSDSALRFGPSSFRPTVMLEDKYVAFAVSSDAARAALAAAKRKDWKPSADLEQACEKVPPAMIMLSVNSDVKEGLSSLLASLPGTLQTVINTTIALVKARAGGATAGGAGQPGSPPRMDMAEGDMRRGPRGGPRGGPMGGSGARGGPMGPMGGAGPTMGQPVPGASGAAGTASDSMIVLKVDPDKLPKADDLKSKMFPTTLSISLAEREIRLTSRAAFPDVAFFVGMVPAMFVSGAAQVPPGGVPPAPEAAAGPAAGLPGAPAPEAAVPGGGGSRRGAGGRGGRRPD